MPAARASSRKRSMGWLECPMVNRSKAAGVMAQSQRMQLFLPDRPGAVGANFRPGRANIPARRPLGRQAREDAMRLAMMAAVMFGLASAAGAAEYMEKTDFQKSRAEIGRAACGGREEI